MNNSNINIAEILRDCPEGMKLHTSVFGNVRFDHVDIIKGVKYPIKVNLPEDEIMKRGFFLANGRYSGASNAECCLFPSKTMRDWTKFFKRGDVVYNCHAQMYAIFSDWVDDTYTEFNTTLCWEKNDNSFSEEQVCATECFERINGHEGNLIQKFEEHYHGKYNPDTLKVEPDKPACPFKPFDRVLVRDEDNKQWEPALFAYSSNILSDCLYGVIAGLNNPVYFKQCIPYEGNEELCGTTKRPKK